MKLNYFKQAFVLACFLAGTSTASSQITTFDYTGSMQTYVVPPGITKIEVLMTGAAGGKSTGAAHLAGNGGKIETTMEVTPGSTLNIFVGGKGETSLGVVSALGGWNGGGNGGVASGFGGGGGGGASDIRIGGTALVNRVLVAGGGGGAAYNYGSGDNGGRGGGLIGGEGLSNFAPYVAGGKGGTQFAGGIAGAYPGYDAAGAGSLGNGGNGGTGSSGGGGGAGYYGGGGGSWAGAGGGSDWVDLSICSLTTSTPGFSTGNGQIRITELCADLTVSVSGTSICLGESFTLKASGAGTITWDGDIINGEEYTPAAIGIVKYTTTSTDDGDCVFSVNIETLEKPVVGVIADKTNVCEGGKVKLKGSGAYIYIWDLGLENGVPFIPELGTTTYTVIGESALGCFDTASIDITVYAAPKVTANGDNAICVGDPLVLTGAGASAYTWDKGVVDGVAFMPKVTGTTTYTVTGTDGIGCKSTAKIDVTVFEAIALAFTSTEEVMGADGAIDMTVTGGNPPYVFDWDKDGAGDFDDTKDLAGLTGGTYIVVVKDEAGCSATETIILNSQVGIYENDQMIFTVYPNPTTDNITIAAEGTFTYQLIGLNGAVLLNGTGINQQEVSLDAFANGIYFVKLKTTGKTHVLKVVKE